MWFSLLDKFISIEQIYILNKRDDENYKEIVLFYDEMLAIIFNLVANNVNTDLFLEVIRLTIY